MVNADNLRKAHPWSPIKDPMDLAILGKLGEECGELIAAISRCIIQGVDEREPVSGKINRDWLMEEVADVRANILLTLQHFNLDEERMHDRTEKKLHHLRDWHYQIGKPEL